MHIKNAKNGRKSADVDAMILIPVLKTAYESPCFSVVGQKSTGEIPSLPDKPRGSLFCWMGKIYSQRCRRTG
jgi:hypothetical protein